MQARVGTHVSTFPDQFIAISACCFTRISRYKYQQLEFGRNNVTTTTAEELIGAFRDNSTANVLANSRPATILLGGGLTHNAEFANSVSAKDRYKWVQAETSEILFDRLRHAPVDLVILPGTGKKLSGLDCCRRIK